MSNRRSRQHRVTSTLLASTLAVTTLFTWSTTAVAIPSTAAATGAPASSAPPLGNAAGEPAPEVQEAVDLAIDLSFPLFENGLKPSPQSLVNRGDRVRSDRNDASDEYRAARLAAINAGRQAGNELLPQNRRMRYAHCSQYISTVVLNTVDPEFAGNLTVRQNEYLNDPESGWMNGWVKIGASEDYDPETYRPGDIFLTRGVGHVFMWIGEHDGYDDVISDAAYFNRRDHELLRLPSLRRYSLDAETGEDSSGRAYDVWRYVGDPQTVMTVRLSSMLDAVETALTVGAPASDAGQNA